MSAAEFEHWNKSPKHLLREAAVRDAISGWPPGRFAEFGAGTGTMTRMLEARGFSGVIHDIGEDTRKALRLEFPADGSVTVVDAVSDLEPSSVDYLFAFEVLEHVVDDTGLLGEWTTRLKPGGRVLVTVPAHMRKFSETDRRVGHVRRYERPELEKLLRSCGYDDVRVINYGFPLGNLSRAVMRNLEREVDVHDEPEDQLERSVRSGVEQPRPVNAISRVVNERTILPFARVQKLFFDRDLGDGYVATGRLRR